MKIGSRSFKSTSLRIAEFSYPVPYPEKVRWLSHLETEPINRNKGDAGRLMKRICREADADGTTLVLELKPYNEPALHINALESFYTRRGFERIKMNRASWRGIRGNE